MLCREYLKALMRTLLLAPTLCGGAVIPCALRQQRTRSVQDRFPRRAQEPEITLDTLNTLVHFRHFFS